MKTIYQLITEARRSDGLNCAEYKHPHPSSKKKKRSSQGLSGGYGCGGYSSRSYGCGGGGCGGYSSRSYGCGGGGC